MKRFLVLAALLSLAIPAVFAAPSAGKGKPEASSSSSSRQSPAALCNEQLQTMGAVNFRSKYAPNGNGKNAFGKCVSVANVQAQDATKNAAKACKAERGTTAESVAAFNEKYGTNVNKRNAFGKCVSQKAKEEVEEEQEETLNAAKACKKEKAAGVQAFADKYGTGNKKNAFGKCVAAQKNDSD